MNYALLNNGIVENVISINPGNAHEFPNAVPVGEYAVEAGDYFDGTSFYRGGVRVKSVSEALAEVLRSISEGVNDVQS